MLTKEICEDKISIVIRINKGINCEYAKETDAKNNATLGQSKAASYFALVLLCNFKVCHPTAALLRKTDIFRMVYSE